MLQINRMKHMH